MESRLDRRITARPPRAQPRSDARRTLRRLQSNMAILCPQTLPGQFSDPENVIRKFYQPSKFV